MSYRYGKADVQFITTKMGEGFKQRDINDLYHLWRTARGTNTKRGDYTNFISKLSPKSKHREKTTTAAYDYSDKNTVIRNIARCLGCSFKHAAGVYKSRVLPVCVSRFHDPSNTSLVSVRYHAPACNDYLYFIFTTEDYAETFELEPSLHTNDVWTVRTENMFKELIDGSLTADDINEQLLVMADNEYIPQLVNVCVLKR